MLFNIFANSFLVLGVLGTLIVFSYMNYYRTKNGWTLGHTWDTPRALFPLCLSWAAYCTGLTIKASVYPEPDQRWQILLWGAITLLFLLQAAGCLSLGRRQWDFSLDGYPGIDAYLKPRKSWRGMLVLVFLIGHLGIAGWQSSSYLNSAIFSQPVVNIIVNGQPNQLSANPTQIVPIEEAISPALSDSNVLDTPEHGVAEKVQRIAAQKGASVEGENIAPTATQNSVELVPDASQLEISHVGQVQVARLAVSSIQKQSSRTEAQPQAPRPSRVNQELSVPTFTSTAIPQPTASDTPLPTTIPPTPTEVPPPTATPIPTAVPATAAPVVIAPKSRQVVAPTIEPTIAPTPVSQERASSPTLPAQSVAQPVAEGVDADDLSQKSTSTTISSTESLPQSESLLQPEPALLYEQIPSWRLWPPTEFSGSDRVDFKWQVEFSLSENQAFEVVLWKPGQMPMEDGFGLAPPSKGEEIHVYLFELDERLGQLLEPGQYHWGVLLVETVPSYKRVAYLGAGHTFRYHPTERPY